MRGVCKYGFRGKNVFVNKKTHYFEETSTKPRT